MSAGISAIATYLPTRIVDNDEIITRFGFDRPFLDGKLGIGRRHIAAEDETVGDMAVSAAKHLIESTGLDPATVDLLVLCTQNPDYRLPTTADLVQHRLGLRTSIAAFDINQGCSGYVYGLSIVAAMMPLHRFRAAILITAEAYSKVIDPSDRNTVPLFGDAATATLVVPDGAGRLGAFTFGSDGSGANDLIVRGGGCRHPAAPIAGNDALHMNGRAIYNFMMRRVPADVRSCLSANALTEEEIDLFLFHQASRFMVESLVKEMRLPPEKVPIRIAGTGNTVSSTIPLLIDALGGTAALSGKTALLSGFGVGLSWASTVVRFATKENG